MEEANNRIHTMRRRKDESHLKSRQLDPSRARSSAKNRQTRMAFPPPPPRTSIFLSRPTPNPSGYQFLPSPSLQIGQARPAVLVGQQERPAPGRVGRVVVVVAAVDGEWEQRPMAKSPPSSWWCCGGGCCWWFCDGWSRHHRGKSCSWAKKGKEGAGGRTKYIYTCKAKFIGQYEGVCNGVVKTIQLHMSIVKCGQ